MVGQARGPAQGPSNNANKASPHLSTNVDADASGEHSVIQQYVTSVSGPTVVAAAVAAGTTATAASYNSQKLQHKLTKNENVIGQQQYYKKLQTTGNNQLLSIIPSKNDVQQQQPNFMAMQQKINEKLLANQSQVQMAPKQSYVNYLPIQKITVNDKVKNNFVLMEGQKNMQGSQTYYTVQQNKPLNTYLAMTPKSDNTTLLMSQNETYVVAPKTGETAYLLPTIQQNKTDLIMLTGNQNSVYIDDNLINNNEKLSFLPNGKTNNYVPEQKVEKKVYENNLPHSLQYLIPNKLNCVSKVKEDVYNYVKKENKKQNNVMKFNKHHEDDFKYKNDDSDEGVEVKPVFDLRYPLVYQIVMTDHNYVLPVFRDHKPLIDNISTSVCSSGEVKTSLGGVKIKDEDNDSLISSDGKTDDEGEETETAVEDEDCSITRCICDMEHDDGYMVCCDKCLVWQHVACVYPDMKAGTPLTGEYLCDACQPRKLDRNRARAFQLQRSKQIEKNMESSDSSSSSLEIAAKQNHPPKKSIARRRAEPVQRKPSKLEINYGRANSTGPGGKVKRGRGGGGGGGDGSSSMKNDNTTSGSTGHHHGTITSSTNNSVNNSAAGTTNTTASSTQSSSLAAANNFVGRRTKCKKKMESKAQLRRKSKSRDEKDVNNSSSNAGTGSGLREWIENYEEAVANHYTQELRNRLRDVLKHVGGGDLNIRSGSGVRCRVSQMNMREKSLVATCNLAYGQPIIELKGNFMLLGQQSAKSEWLFYYKLPKDGTEVVVDVSKYGNCSRYVRRSCKPNSQIKHSVEKNSLRLFLVTCSNLEKNEEITLSHSSWLTNTPNSAANNKCACDGRDCTMLLNNIHTTQSERRRRGRRRTVSEESGEGSPVKYNKTSDVRREVLVETRRNSTVLQTTNNQQVSPSPTSPTYNETNITSSSKDKDRKLTRDERKIEQALKIFAQMERDTARKKDKDHNRPGENIIGSGGSCGGGGGGLGSGTSSSSCGGGGTAVSVGASTRSTRKSSHNPIYNNNNRQDSDKESSINNNELSRPKRRKRRKGRSNTTSSDNGNQNRRLRFNSADSDLTSADEFTSPVRDQRSSRESRDSTSSPVKSGGRSLRQRTSNRRDSTSSSRSRDRDTMNDAAGVLLALSGSRTPPRSVQPMVNSGKDSEGEGSPHTPLSSACLLVAAAVGPLAPGFKFPKTKKGLMNEWLSKSPEPVTPDYPAPSTLSDHSVGAGSPLVKDLTLPPGAPKLSNLSSRLFSLAAAAAAEEKDKSAVDQLDVKGGGFAKKRWLRQAISEECEVPTSSQPDNVTPLKKRRMARESMSSEPSGTPPPSSNTDRTGDVNSPESEAAIMDAESEISLTERVNVLCREYYEAQQGIKCETPPPATTSTAIPTTAPPQPQPPPKEDEVGVTGDEKPLDLTSETESVKTETNLAVAAPGPKSKGRRNASKKTTEQSVTDMVRSSPRLRKCDKKSEIEEDVEMKVEPAEAETVEVKEEKAVEPVEQQVKEEVKQEEEEVEKKDDVEVDLRKVDDESKQEQVADTKNETGEDDVMEQDLSLFEECSSNDKSNDCPPELKCMDEEKLPPAKRKLSITEYRNRKKCLTGGTKSANSDNGQQQTSPQLNSDDDFNSTGDCSPPSLPSMLLDPADAILGKPGIVRFKPEPTELERQRENLTERLRREFGLHIPDDEPKVSEPPLPPLPSPQPPLPPQSPPVLVPSAAPPPATTPTNTAEPSTPEYELYNQECESAIYPVGSSNPPNPNVVAFPDLERKIMFKK